MTDTERVSTTAFLSKIRPDWADARLSRGFLPPSYLLLLLSTFHHPLLAYSFLSFDYSAPAAYIAVCQRSPSRSHKPSHEPYAKWMILISRFRPPFLAYYCINPSLTAALISHLVKPFRTCRSHGYPRSVTSVSILYPGNRLNKTGRDKRQGATRNLQWRCF